MKAGWENTTLADVLSTLKNGFNCKQDKNGPGDRISRIESISLGVFDLDRVGFTSIPDSDKRKFRLQRGDILFSHINSPAHVGKTAVFDYDEEVYHEVNLLLMRPSPRLSSDYLSYYLKFLYIKGFWRKLCKQSVNQASVNQRDIGHVSIMFPNLKEEQERIVAILDQAFAGIAAATALCELNCRNQQQFFKSSLNNLFKDEGGLPSLRISDIAVVFDGPHATPKTVEEGPIFLGIGALQNGSINLDEARHVTEQDFQKWTRRVTPRANDFVFSYETRLGEAALIPAGLDCCLGRRMGLLRLNCNFVEPQYFLYFYQSQQFQDFLTTKIIRGATVDRISIRDFPSFPITLPPLSVQQDSVAKINALRIETERLQGVYRQKLTALAALKQSLLHQAFSGNL